LGGYFHGRGGGLPIPSKLLNLTRISYIIQNSFQIFENLLKTFKKAKNFPKGGGGGASSLCGKFQQFYFYFYSNLSLLDPTIGRGPQNINSGIYEQLPIVSYSNFKL
jgi:hypothetical protein